MSSITKLSCPVCGCRVTLRQLKKAEEHREIKAFTFTFGGKVKGDNKGRGKAKGICEFVETETAGNDSLEEYWIKKLTEIITYLKGNEIEHNEENEYSTLKYEIDAHKSLKKYNVIEIENEEEDNKIELGKKDSDYNKHGRNVVEIDNEKENKIDVSSPLYVSLQKYKVPKIISKLKSKSIKKTNHHHKIEFEEDEDECETYGLNEIDLDDDENKDEDENEINTKGKNTLEFD